MNDRNFKQNRSLVLKENGITYQQDPGQIGINSLSHPKELDMISTILKIPKKKKKTKENKKNMKQRGRRRKPSDNL